MNQHLCKHMHATFVQHPELLKVIPGISEEDRREEILQISQLHEMSALPVISDFFVDIPSAIEVKGVEIPNHGPAESWTRYEKVEIHQILQCCQLKSGYTNVCLILLIMYHHYGMSLLFLKLFGDRYPC